MLGETKMWRRLLGAALVASTLRCTIGWLSGRDLLDCEFDPAWAFFRRSLVANADQGFPLDAELILQAQELLQTHQEQLVPDYANMYGMSPGMQSFFLNCNQPPSLEEALPAPFCLYGAIAALWLLARAGNDRTGLLSHARYLLGAAMRHSLDFVDSSSWPVSSIDILANLQRPAERFRLPAELAPQYVEAASLHSKIPDAAAWPLWPPSRSHGRQQPPVRLVVWELGVHASLSAEPLHMWARALPGVDIVHRNLIQDQYPQWLPDKCETLYSHARLRCDTFRDDITHVFERRIPNSATSNEPIESIDEFASEFAAVAGSRLQDVDVFLCTIAYLCLLVEPTGRPIIGYFGHPLLFMTPRTDEARSRFWKQFVAMASKESVEFACDGPFLQMQYDYQVGSPRLTVIRTHALYTGATHFPARPNEVLVLDRPHESVMMCVIQRFLPEPSHEDVEAWATGDGRLKAARSSSFPYRFITRGATDKQFRTFAQFRAVVLWPYDMDLVTYYEFYSMAMPIFMPSHLSKYIFEQDHMWYDGRWEGAVWNSPSLWLQEGGDSPFNESSAYAAKDTVTFTDYFRFPHVQYFQSIAQLLDLLTTTDFFAVVQSMAMFNQESLMQSNTAWITLLQKVLAQNVAIG